MPAGGGHRPLAFAGALASHRRPGSSTTTRVNAAVEVTDERIPSLGLGDTRGGRTSPRARPVRTTAYFAFWTVNFRL